jgi:thiol-disulfide isomerase/thioredoxin
MRLIYAIFLLLFATLQLTAQGIEFFHGTWKEALDESKKLGRPIFVDAYAKWCGPCKRMAATTFKDNEVGEYFNKNFINVKMDAEEGEGVTFRKKYPISAYPTLFFIDGEGEVIHKAVGGQDVKSFLKLGEFALGKVDFSRDFAAEYEKGSREPELIFNYVQALNKSNKPSLSISNEYLRSQKDLTTAFNLKFIHEAAVEADSRIFGLLVQYKKEIGALVGLQALKDRILYACENTAQKAVDFQSAELLEEAKSKMKEHFPEKAAAFAAKADMDYFKATQDAKKFGKACSDYAKTAVNGNPKDLNKLAEEIQGSFGKDESCMKMAEKYAKEAAEKGRQYQYYLTYADILQQNGKKKQAMEAANKALELAKEAGEPAQQQVQQFIKQLES